MNPSRISTPINKEIDEWHFNTCPGEKKVMHFRIDMHRPRDIESNDPMEFIAVSQSKWMEENNNAIVIRATSIPDLREKCLALARAYEESHWEKIIVVYAADAAICWSADVSDHPIKFDWGMGYRSKDGRFFRKMDMETESNSYTYQDAGYLMKSGNKDGKCIVHPWTKELEESMKAMDEKFRQFSEALSAMIKSPQQIQAISQKLLA